MPPYLPSSASVDPMEQDSTLPPGIICRYYRWEVKMFCRDSYRKGATSLFSPYFGHPDEWVWQMHFDNLPTTYEYYNAYPVRVTLIAILNSSELINPSWLRKTRSIELSVFDKSTGSVHLRSSEAVAFSECNWKWSMHSSDFDELTMLESVYVECRILYPGENSIDTETDELGDSLFSALESINEDPNIMMPERYEKGRECAMLADCPIPDFEYTDASDVPYQFVKELGIGTSSRVDEVRSVNNNKTFARKSIRCSTAEASTVQKYVRHEVTIVRRLNHDHIVTIHCTYREPRSFNIILSPVADGDLQWFLGQCTAENYAETHLRLIRIWFACLAGALAYVHGESIRHRDIKPGNILVKGSKIFLTDFGIANDFIAELTSSTRSGYCAKTIMYCAPEVADADGRRSRSADVFSLGCVFAEMATVMDKRSVAAFYQHRMKDSSHAYFRTLDLVHQWLSGCICYSRFINLMLSPNRSARPSAALVEKLIQTGGLDGREGISCDHK